MDLHYDKNPLLELDHSNKYKVIEVYDTSGNKVDRLAMLGHDLPYATLNNLGVGGIWSNKKEQRIYERVI